MYHESVCGAFEKVDIDGKCLQGFTKIYRGTYFFLQYQGKRTVRITGRPHNLYVVKFIYSEKATKFCEIFILLLTGTT